MPSKHNSDSHEKQTNTSSESMQRFQDLTRKIVKVSKGDVDEIDPLVQKRKKRRQAKSKK